MAKGRRNKGRKNPAKKRTDDQKDKNGWDSRGQSYVEIVRENKDFELYYKTQGIVSESDWDSFIKTMQEDLPAAFRITGSKSETKALLNIIKTNFFEKETDKKVETLGDDDNKDKDETSLEPEKVKPKCLPFYPDNLAWQLQLTRKDIRRSEENFRLHNFLITETNAGSISRQEVVSMIPPLVLDVKPSHKVLDMCAAPGSKTAQLIELIHADESIPHPEGFVIANDVDNNRCYMLVHQAKRLNSPNILITNHDSSIMPNFKVTNADGTKGILKFDRILADVPCTGDGTMRKNPDIWCKWNPAMGNNLHGIQFRIAKRGLEMLAIGGKMVYSTCSLNPIENEAVLHRILQEAGDSVRILDGRKYVPGLKCNPGVTHWLPGTKDMVFYKSWDEVPQQWHTQIRPNMFPPKPEDADKYNLDKCIRILPNHQDTGGFFVAILEKIKLLPWESSNDNKNTVNSKEVKETEKQDESKEEKVDENIDENNEKRKLDEQEKEEDTKNICPKKPRLEDSNTLSQGKKKRVLGFREDPFVFFKDENEDVFPSIKKFYDISDKLDPKCLLVRCREGKKKNIYFASPAIRDILLLNESNVKMINSGVKTFVRCDNKNMHCAFRLAQEGLHSVIPFIGESRKIKIDKEDLISLLENDNPREPPEITKLSEELQKRTVGIPSGSCILMYEDKNNDDSEPFKMQLVGWRGTMSLRAYIPSHDLVHYLRLLGADCSKYEKNKFEVSRNAIKEQEGNNEAEKNDKEDEEKNIDAEIITEKKTEKLDNMECEKMDETV
ncbi:hypothetical protein HCN44_000290 [Aphidius gifuensis]|uniref:tRNA (cytosine(34)-C(5))-methyltransferase n=1 Tax=Aphidius gifuensis TaxID=684658 RepID=A0A835CRR0_APHGI|nr:tRNA (cytosine(34)-C(5))-methyltransferase [Aphidius gifuensis]KAF7990485.1 hypothetical protein HCN44_000290 [Aphidius gifuensis]